MLDFFDSEFNKHSMNSDSVKSDGQWHRKALTLLDGLLTNTRFFPDTLLLRILLND